MADCWARRAVSCGNFLRRRRHSHPQYDGKRSGDAESRPRQAERGEQTTASLL